MWIRDFGDSFNLKQQLLRALDAFAAQERDHYLTIAFRVIALQALVRESEFLSRDTDGNARIFIRSGS